MNDDLAYQILEIVAEIPEGKVASYKQIAILAGRSQNARLVGKILSHSEQYGNYPCHRLVNSGGRLVPDWIKQRELLCQEGVGFKSNGNVYMKECQWQIL